MPDRRGWFGPALALVAAITAARIVALAFNHTDLFVDEAQYWLWGQELAFGYYSKPPLVGWVIRAATDLAGSDAAFWVRLPAPVFHAATALILGRIAAGLFGARAGWVAAATYATLPMVAVGSLMISTDTVMFPFVAAATGLWLHLLSGQARRPLVLAAAAGAALGLGFLAKYAAIYPLLLAASAAVLPRWRPRPGEATVALAAFALVIAPNVAWNLANGLTTVEHTMDNAGWLRGGPDSLEPGRMFGFLLSQTGVFGPVAFGVLGWLGLRRLRGPLPGIPGLLLWLSLPVVLLVSIQGLLERAYANWAAVAYLAGTLAVAGWFAARPRWLALSLALNGAVCLALPLLAIFVEGPVIRGEPVLHRYLGRAELSRRILDAAETTGAAAIVTPHRDVLADLFHTGRDAGVPIHALPVAGRVPHYYAQVHAYPGGPGPVLVVGMDASALPCADRAEAAGALTAGPGNYFGTTFPLWLVPGDCWESPR